MKMWEKIGTGAIVAALIAVGIAFAVPLLSIQPQTPAEGPAAPVYLISDYQHPTPTPVPVVVEVAPAPPVVETPEIVYCPAGTVAGYVDDYGNEGNCYELNDEGQQCVAYDDANNCTAWYQG